jgi:hypothetical protein
VRLVLKLGTHHRFGEADRADDRRFASAEFDMPHEIFLAASIPTKSSHRAT